MKIIDHIWFSSFLGIAGIVIGEDVVTGERKAYVGIADGTSVEHDIQTIAQNGCPLSPVVSKHLDSLLNGTSPNPSLQSVLNERTRQDEKWGEQNHNPYIYLAILLEEVGELSQAILQTQYGGPHGGGASIRMEAVHTAAVALAIVECLDRAKWRDDDVHLENVNRS